jgi:hypothetical protein
MNQRQLASVLFAATGIFIAASYLTGILTQLSAAIPVPDSGASSLPLSQLVPGVIGSLLALLLACALVLLRDRLANRLFPPTTETLSSREFHAVALSVLGSYFVVQGFAHLAWTRYFNWSGLTQLVLGAALFFGGRALSRAWALGRTAGLSSSSEKGAV